MCDSNKDIWEFPGPYPLPIEKVSPDNRKRKSNVERIFQSWRSYASKWNEPSFIECVNEAIRESGYGYDVPLYKLKQLSVKFDSTVIKAAEEKLTSLSLKEERSESVG